MNALYKRHKLLLAIILTVSVVFFAIDQTSAVAQPMHWGDCAMKASCGTCAIPLETFSNTRAFLAPSLDFVPDYNGHESPLYREPLYHPPQ
ncbi:MAG: hypothetical protein HZA02_08705, partial [Nitrospinae bacterium]|nr:hypothetical protein [Nitrospinota bacterium]